jgi:hypothetical protein
MQSKYKNIKDVYDQLCAHVHPDKHLYKAACSLQEGFVNKKREHIEFFGGNLTGVQVVRFTDQERDKLFDILLQADEYQLKDEVYALKDMHGNPAINQNFIVSSDIFNISCVWLLHRIHHAEDHELNAEERLDAKARVCAFLLYKFLTSLLFHYFKYPADPEVAAATYAELSRKYALKQHGSWGAALMNMAIGLVGPTSIHVNTIDKLDDDYDIVKMLNDIQGRVKDMLKNIYSVFMEVNAHGGRISSSTSFHEIEGEIELKDQTKSLGVYTQYLRRIITDKPSFIKDELVDVVSNMMHTMAPRMLYQALSWTSDNYKGQHDGKINAAIDLVMEHAIEYLSANRDITRTDVGAVLDKLRGAYMSSRSTDAKLIKARSDVEEIIKLATGSRNDNAVASVRTAWMLYLVARAYTMRHYANA